LVAGMAGLPRGAVLAGRTGLAGLARLVAGVALVICGDTGVGHLATATATPSVLLFGPVPPSQWGPLRDRERHTVLWSGGTGDPHGGVPDPGLLAIAVPEVLAAARALLAGAARSGSAPSGATSADAGPSGAGRSGARPASAAPYSPAAARQPDRFRHHPPA